MDKSIALVGIPHLAHRMVHTLSDGERQKVMIAKALAQETPGDLSGRTDGISRFPQ